MKKLSSLLMVAAIILGISATAFSKEFKGIINYKISFPGTDMDASMAAMMPKMAILTIRGDMSKLEINMGQMGSQSQIFNGIDKTVTTCMNLVPMGQKFYYTESQEDLEAELDEGASVDIDVKDETKTIAGYECKKAVITVIDDSNEVMFTVYFTDEITSSSLNMDNPYFKDIPGAMLEFEIDTGQGQRMKMEAVSVDKKNISESEFDIPEGYDKKTAEEVEQMFGGGM
jgi:GLPGLI family protein